MSETREFDYDEDNGFLSIVDAARIGFKLVEMADRLKDVDLAMPGSQATWNFEIDDRRYVVTVKTAEAPPTPPTKGTTP